MTRHRAAIALIGIFASAAAAADWPQFRGPNMAGIADATALPDHWGPGENIRWMAPLPGRGVSSPVIIGDRIFVTACSGLNQTRLHVLCFDADSGAKIWERSLWATGPTNCNPKTCMAAPTPSADGDHLIALFATGDLICFNHAGDVCWLRTLQLDFPAMSNFVGRGASPVVHDGMLIVPMESQGASFLFGLDAATGRTRWKADRPLANAYTTPLLVRNGQRTELVVQAQDGLTAYYPASGEKRWEFRDDARSLIASPVLSDGLILAPGRDMVALRPKGNGPPDLVWRSARLSSGTATPLLNAGRVYTIKDGGILVCGDMRSGKEIWSLRLRGTYSASPLMAGERLYLINEDGETTVIRPSDPPEKIAINNLGEAMLGTPAIARGCIFFRSDGHLRCVGQSKDRK